MLWWKVDRASTKPSIRVTVMQMGAPACAQQESLCANKQCQNQRIVLQAMSHVLLVPT